MTVITTEIVRNQPVGLRGLVGKHLAGPRWRETCDYYRGMMERERLTICFHAQLKQRHAVLGLEEMNEGDRQRVVCSIGELRTAFAKHRRHRISDSDFIARLTVSQRRTLFMHAGLTEAEFSQPYWRINDEACSWREALFKALRELFSLFEYAPTILTAVKPEQYLH
ncbi:TPA: replication protein B [Serratia fonticola]